MNVWWRQHGLSMPEMLIALFSSTLLMSVLSNQYLGVKQRYQQLSDELEQSFDVQLVMDLMRQTVRQAGFTPCLGVEHLTTIDRRFERPGLKAINLDSGLQVNHMSPYFGYLLKQTGLTTFRSSKNVILSGKRPILIADCFHAEVHRIQDLKQQGEYWEIELEKPLSFDYQSPIYVGEWIEERFYLKNERLFFDAGHIDALSDSIKAWSISLTSQSHYRLLHLNLTLHTGHVVNMDTMLRIS